MTLEELSALPDGAFVVTYWPGDRVITLDVVTPSRQGTLMFAGNKADSGKYDGDIYSLAGENSVVINPSDPRHTFCVALLMEFELLGGVDCIIRPEILDWWKELTNDQT